MIIKYRQLNLHNQNDLNESAMYGKNLYEYHVKLLNDKELKSFYNNLTTIAHFRDYTLEDYKLGYRYCIIEDVCGKSIGCVSYKKEKHIVSIREVYINKHYRSKGIFKNFINSMFLDMNVLGIELCVRKSNNVAIDSYIRTGFHIINKDVNKNMGFVEMVLDRKVLSR